MPVTIVTRPSSSGCRSASRTSRENSGQLVEEQDAVVGARHLARLRAAARRRRSPRTSSCGAAPGTAACGRGRGSGLAGRRTRRSWPRASPRPKRRQQPGIVLASIVLPGPRRARSSAGRGRPPAPPRAPAAPRPGRERRRGPVAACGGARIGPAAGSRHRRPAQLHPGRRVAGACRRLERSASTASATSRRARPRDRRRAGPPRRPRAGTITRRTPRRASAATIGSSPGTGRISPPSETSPISAARPARAVNCSDPIRIRSRSRGPQRRPGLRHVRRREVDGDPARRMHEAGVAQRAADPLARLADRRVAEPDDREPGQPGRHVDLDADDPPVEGDERGGEQGREHPATLRGRAYLRLIPRDIDCPRDGYRGAPAPAPARGAPAGAPARPATWGAKVRRSRAPGPRSPCPAANRASAYENGEPVFCAEIATRYSFVIFVSNSRFSALSAAPTLMPVNAFERLRTSLRRFGSKPTGAAPRAPGARS